MAMSFSGTVRGWRTAGGRRHPQQPGRPSTGGDHALADQHRARASARPLQRARRCGARVQRRCDLRGRQRRTSTVTGRCRRGRCRPCSVARRQRGGCRVVDIRPRWRSWWPRHRPAAPCAPAPSRCRRCRARSCGRASRWWRRRAPASRRRPRSGRRVRGAARGRAGDGGDADANDAPGARCSAMSPPLLTQARSMPPALVAGDQLLRDRAGDRGHRRDEARREWRAGAATCAARRRAAQRARAADGLAQQRQLGDQLVEHAGEARHAASCAGLRRPRGVAVGADDEVDRPVLEMPAPAGQGSPGRVIGAHRSTAAAERPRIAGDARARRSARRSCATRRAPARPRASARGPCGRRAPR